MQSDKLSDPESYGEIKIKGLHIYLVIAHFYYLTIKYLEDLFCLIDNWFYFITFYFKIKIITILIIFIHLEN